MIRSVGPARTLKLDVEFGILQIMDIVEQIRPYGKSDATVNLRMLRALGDVAVATGVPEFHQMLLE